LGVRVYSLRIIHIMPTATPTPAAPNATHASPHGLFTRVALGTGRHGRVQRRQLAHHAFILLLFISMHRLRMLAQIIEAGELLPAVACEGAFAGVLSNMSGQMLAPRKDHSTLAISPARKRLCRRSAISFRRIRIRVWTEIWITRRRRARARALTGATLRRDLYGRRLTRCLLTSSGWLTAVAGPLSAPCSLLLAPYAPCSCACSRACSCASSCSCSCSCSGTSSAPSAPTGFGARGKRLVVHASRGERRG